jgi:glycerol uptake facilitator-like aquaporin
MPFADLMVYIVAQVGGALVGAAIVLLIAQGSSAYVLSPSTFATNGYGIHSPGGYDLASCLLAECVLTFFFVLVVLGSTSARAPSQIAGMAIGLALTAVHLVGIRITNMSVNPAPVDGTGHHRRALGVGAALALLGGAPLRRSDRRRHGAALENRQSGRRAARSAGRRDRAASNRHVAEVMRARKKAPG